MANQIIAATLQIDSDKANQSVKSFKTQLKEAKEELLTIRDRFGDLSPEAINAAKRVSQLTDNIKDANEVVGLFDPGAKFQVLGNTIRTVTGGFSALTGAMTIFGAESEDVAKTLARVQGALALTEGINTIVDAGKDFQRLKAIAIDTFKGIRTAILTTGIGALVVLVGTLVAYWDEIKEAVSGVSSAQKENLDIATKLVEKEEERLKHVNDQDNILRLQGKTEKEILQLKINQTNEVIAARKQQLAAQEEIAKAQIATAERNRNILAGILRFVRLPITLVLEGILQIAKLIPGLKEGAKNIEESISSFDKKIAGVLFDPEETKKKSEEELNVIRNSIKTLENTRAGYQLTIRDIDKKAADERKQKLKEQLDREQNALSELRKIRQENYLLEIEDEKKRARERLLINAENERERIKQLRISEQTKANLIMEVNRRLRDELNAFDRQNEEEQKAKDAEKLQRNLDFVINSLTATTQLSKDQIGLRKELDDQQKTEFDIQLQDLDKWYKDKQAIAGANEALQNDLTKEYEKRRTKIVEAENILRLDIVGNFLKQGASLLGKQTAAGKALAVAAATIDTYKAANSALKADYGIFGPAAQVARFTAVALTIATGLKNVKEIIKTQVPGGGGSTASIPAVSTIAAPITPQAATTTIDQESINNIGNAAAGGVNAVRAYVVESDVADNGERMSRLNRAAVLGG